MKKGFTTILLAFAISWLTSCEKEVSDINPTMETYYMESKGLSAVTIDSVSLFKNKVEGFVTANPIAKEHEKYPLIQANIKSASLRITITCDTIWAGEETIHF